MDTVLIKEVLLVFIWHLPSILLMGVVLVTKGFVNSNQIRYCITIDLTVKVVLPVVHHWSALILKGAMWVMEHVKEAAGLQCYSNNLV